MFLNRSPELKPKRADALVVLAVLLLALGVGARFWRAPAQTVPPVAVVAVEGAEVERLPLADAERVYTNRGHTLRVLFSADGVRVAEADCPTQDCVHRGAISRAGESIVCLPARIVITLEGAADFDVIVG